MKCGSCGAPLARGIHRCPFCGASAKYAFTEQGQLPYEPVPSMPHAEKPEPLKPPEPRWDLEPPQGTSYSRWRSLRGIYRTWASLERRRSSNKSGRGCLLTGVLFVLIVILCGEISFAESRAYQRILAMTPTPTLSAREMTATATTSPNPYQPHQGLLALSDPLNGNNGEYAWMDYNLDQTSTNQGCEFQDKAYSTSKPAQNVPRLRYCLAVETHFQNFAYQIDMTNRRGHSGGIIFRQNAPSNFYYFSLTIDGSYTLWLNTGNTGKILAHGSSTAIHRGNKQINTLAVVANSATIDLYANNVHLTTAYDKTYSAGRIGTAVGTPDAAATTCSFANAEVWVL